MELYLVPFSLLDLVLLSPVYAWIVWFIFRRIRRKKRKFTGFITWSVIIHASVIPVFWLLHKMGAFRFVESDHSQFDPVIITGHIGGFFTVYCLFCGGLTMAILAKVKWKAV